MMRRTLAAVLLTGLALGGCSRDEEGILPAGDPTATILTVTPTTSTRDGSWVTVFFSVSTDVGPVADLSVGNIYIVVDGEPVLPVGLSAVPGVPGDYQVSYRQDLFEDSFSFTVTYGNLIDTVSF
jgi:hypothetical protein